MRSDAESRTVINNGAQTNTLSANSGLILVAGILFWAHGNASSDAWFKGEEVTGQAITGAIIGIYGLVVCCCMAACCVAANPGDSELDVSANEINRANRFLTNSAPRQLMADLFKAKDNAEQNAAPDTSISCNV